MVIGHLLNKPCKLFGTLIDRARAVRGVILCTAFSRSKTLETFFTTAKPKQSHENFPFGCDRRTICVSADALGLSGHATLTYQWTYMSWFWAKKGYHFGPHILLGLVSGWFLKIFRLLFLFLTEPFLFGLGLIEVTHEGIFAINSDGWRIICFSASLWIVIYYPITVFPHKLQKDEKQRSIRD